MVPLVPKYMQISNMVPHRKLNDVMETETRFWETCFRFYGILFRCYGNGNEFLGNVFPFPRNGFFYSRVCLCVVNSANNDPAKKRRVDLIVTGRSVAAT